MVRVDGNGGSQSLISVRGLNKTYSRGGEKIQVLQGLNLDVDKGDFVAFMGPSGSGKTTLLNLLGGLDVPSAGSITVAGDEITHMSSSKLTHWRARHVGFIFQMYNLIPVLTAYQNVELPLLLTKLSGSDRRKHVETALAVVGLADRMHHYPRQLSGGQEQRVTIARAIVSDPTFLLCDEPTGDLDRKSADEIMALIEELVGKYNKTILMVTHDPVVAARAHTTLHLEKGVLVEASKLGESVLAGSAGERAKPRLRPAPIEDVLRRDYGLTRRATGWEYQGAGNKDIAGQLYDPQVIVGTFRKIANQIDLNGLCLVAGLSPFIVMKAPNGSQKGPYCWVTSLNADQIADTIARLVAEFGLALTEYDGCFVLQKAG